MSNEIGPEKPGGNCGQSIGATPPLAHGTMPTRYRRQAYVPFVAGPSGDLLFSLDHRVAPSSAGQVPGVRPFLLFASNSRKSFALLLISKLRGLAVYRRLQMPMRIPFWRLGAFPVWISPPVFT